MVGFRYSEVIVHSCLSFGKYRIFVNQASPFTHPFTMFLESRGSDVSITGIQKRLSFFSLIDCNVNE